MSKVITAINLKYFAYKNFNDFFVPSFSSKSNHGFNKAKLITHAGIATQDILCKLKLMDYGLTTVILFKNDVDADLIQSLKKNGYSIIKLPVNPFI